METPPTYLSVNEMGWALIKDGMPLCAHTSKEGAIQCASRFKLDLPAVIWDGIKGEFVERVDISC